MSYVVTYGTYDTALCAFLATWEVEAPDLECLDFATADTSACLQSVRRGGPSPSCCGVGYGQGPFGGSGSGSGADTSYVAEYTTYDFSACRATLVECEQIPNCGEPAC